ncbi:hypothetical protein FSP39_008696 [Pinctada imbricata]|uniref:Uncharacterized protein n=1 Tax=Pinctada imbricata TaxID=66713 RepID=A0AA89BN69_PINIB|nr:hypothetical protein FSP39_008696 [Pinctada imbricata]
MMEPDPDDILRDQANKENRAEKPSKSQRKKNKDKKRQKQEEDPDANILAMINSKEVAAPQPQNPGRKVENCPHIDRNDEYSFMCSTCRIICCELCLKDGHEGHKWCELVPYIPSEDEEEVDCEYHYQNDGANDSPEEEIHINTNGRRRLKGGFVNTRKPRSKRDKNCSCRGCKHDPRHLKRIVPIDESRFSKPSDLLSIENGSSKEDGTLKKKKKKKKKGKQSVNDVADNSGDEQKDCDIIEDKTLLLNEDSEVKDSVETNCEFHDKDKEFFEEKPCEQNEKERKINVENKGDLPEELSVNSKSSEDASVDSSFKHSKLETEKSSAEAVSKSIKVNDQTASNKQNLSEESVSEPFKPSNSFKAKQVPPEEKKERNPRPLHESYEKEIRAELERQFNMKAHTADELDQIDQNAITLKLEIKRELHDGKAEVTKKLTIDRNLNAGYMKELNSRKHNPEFSPDECGEFARKLLEEDDEPEVTDALIKDLCQYLKRKEEKQDSMEQVDNVEKPKEPKTEKIMKVEQIENEGEKPKMKDAESETFVKAQTKPENVNQKTEKCFEISESDLLTPDNYITNFIKIDSVTKAKFFDAFRIHLKEKDESKANLPLWKKELQAKLEKYDNIHGFTKAVKDWLKIPSNDRLYSVYDAWKIAYDENPRRIVERLAPTERERFIKQMKKVLEKCLTKMNRLAEKASQHLDEDDWEQKYSDVYSGIVEIKERFSLAYQLKFLPTDCEYIQEQLEDFYVPECRAPTNGPKLEDGCVMFGELTKNIKFALEVLCIPEEFIEEVNDDTVRSFLSHDLSRDGVLKQVLMWGIPMTQVLNKVTEDPKDWLKEVDEKEMKHDKLWETFVTAEKQRLGAIKDELPVRLTNWLNGVQRHISKDSGKEALQILQEGRSMFPFVGSDKNKNQKPSVPDDIYALYVVDNGVWVHKTGCDTNVLISTKGNVKKEFDFGTSIEDFTTSSDGTLLASDPSEYRIIALRNVQNSYAVKNYIRFDKLMPLGIEATIDGNIVVCLVENYYRYDVKENMRRLVAKITPEGKFLGQIEWRAKGERWFTVPRRAAEAVNGDVAVIDRYRFDRGRVIMFHRDGTFKHQWAGHSEICNKPFDPRDMIFDAKGRLFIVDYSNNVVLMFDLDYERITVICHDTLMKGLTYPLCIAKDKRNQMWIGCKFGKIMFFSLKKEVKFYSVQ